MPAQELVWFLILINDQVCPSRSKSASSKERKFHGRDWTFEAEAPASSIQNCLLSGWFRNKSFCRRRMQATYSEIPQFLHTSDKESTLGCVLRSFLKQCAPHSSKGIMNDMTFGTFLIHGRYGNHPES